MLGGEINFFIKIVLMNALCFSKRCTRIWYVKYSHNVISSCIIYGMYDLQNHYQTAEFTKGMFTRDTSRTAVNT